MVLTNFARAGFALLLVVSLPASAAITCCDVDGKRTCGNPAPQQCLDKAKKVFGKGGVSQEVEAPLTAEQKAKREAEEARLAEEKKQKLEQERRDRALVNSYSSVKEIDAARDRAIAEIEKNAEQAGNRLESAQAKQKTLNQEVEFYQKKPVPGVLQSRIKDNDAEIAAQQAALQKKDADIAATKERYEAEKTRYRQLTGKK